MEILSPGNNKKEIAYKHDVYEQSGVIEYWLLFPQDKSLLCYRRDENGKLVAGRARSAGEIFESSYLSGFKLDLTEVLEDVPDEPGY